METSIEMYNFMKPHIIDGVNTLEPSAGYGFLAVKLATVHGCTVDVVELNGSRYKVLVKQQLYRKCYKEDFLTWKEGYTLKYDQIVAVPPYKDNIDCRHIMAMMELLKPMGRLVAYTHPAWVTGFYFNQLEFRMWLNEQNYKIRFLEDKSYMSCPKALLVIQK